MAQVYAKNKKAYVLYEILDKIEAGVTLTGGEVKSVKGGHVNLTGSFVDVRSEKPWLKNVHISKYKYDNAIIDPLRARLLLLKKDEIRRLEEKLSTKGITAIPLELYDKNRLVKVLIGVCRGKKLHDRREDLKKKSQIRDIERELKRRK